MKDVILSIIISLIVGVALEFVFGPKIKRFVVSVLQKLTSKVSGQ